MFGDKSVLVTYFLACAHLVLAYEYVFEFGNDEGQIIYSKDGGIPLLQYNAVVDIPVQPGMRITYVKVTVRSLSPPKVDYDYMFRRVNIKYNWSQLTSSTFNIIVKGFPN